MAKVTAPKKQTLKSLAAAVRRLQERVADMEDLMDLRSAVKRNGRKPGVRWGQAKRELGLD